MTEAVDPNETANSRWKLVRQAAWFDVGVLAVLRQMSGSGEPCMWCDCNTCTDVEHYRPKAVFPHLAFMWENYLWACTECNRFKSNRFPPDTEEGDQILNPLEDRVWNHFYIDQFGNLNPVWNNRFKGLDPRAVSTNLVVKLDREILQIRRQTRLLEIRQTVLDSLHRFQAGVLSRQQLMTRMRSLVEAPFQPDVAEYFLKGPGQQEEPFKTLIGVLGPGAL
ncbi:MAG TPA: hypothetical protein VJU77_04185 [Chthoniobacterales bacterium]|nr:hypothetical protein [Chthoniobacterales bacterium]